MSPNFYCDDQMVPYSGTNLGVNGPAQILNCIIGCLSYVLQSTGLIQNYIHLGKLRNRRWFIL